MAKPGRKPPPFTCSGDAGTLWQICRDEFFPRRLNLRSSKTKVCYQYALNQFGKFLGREPMPTDLDDDTVTAWLKVQLENEAMSVYTVRERIGRIITLWNWLAKRRAVPMFPTVQRPAGPETTPLALGREQLSALFEAALFEPGEIAGIRAGHWWQAFLAFVWSSAERRSAALSVRWEWIDFERKLVVVPPKFRKGQRKGGLYTLWDEVAALLKRIEKPERELVFPWPFSMGKYFHNYGRILLRAGLPNSSKLKTHCLRASHATWLEVFGGDATKALMHGDRSTTIKSYIDPRHMVTQKRTLFVPWEEAKKDLTGLNLEAACAAEAQTFI